MLVTSAGVRGWYVETNTTGWMCSVEIAKLTSDNSNDAEWAVSHLRPQYKSRPNYRCG